MFHPLISKLHFINDNFSKTSTPNFIVSMRYPSELRNTSPSKNPLQNIIYHSKTKEKCFIDVVIEFFKNFIIGIKFLSFNGPPPPKSLNTKSIMKIIMTRMSQSKNGLPSGRKSQGQSVKCLNPDLKSIDYPVKIGPE